MKRYSFCACWGWIVLRFSFFWMEIGCHSYLATIELLLFPVRTFDSGDSGSDHTVLYCVLGGSAAAALIAAGGYAMMPGAKSKKKRAARPVEAAAVAEEAPEITGAGLEMQAPSGYLPLPQPAFVPQGFQYSQGQYMAYQPGAFQGYQPMAYQAAYQQPMAMEPTTYMPTA